MFLKLFGDVIEKYDLNDIDMSSGDWLILARTKSLLKNIPTFLKKKGLFFSTAQGNSIGKSLYEDIKNLSSTEILKLCGYDDATEFDTNDLYLGPIKLEPVWSCNQE